MLRRIHRDEQGVALITIIGVSMVLALLVAGLLQYGVGSQRQARYDQDWHAALAAAHAGIDDFLARVNRDIAYWQQADEDCEDCTGALDPDNPALHGFTEIPGGQSQFRYEVDASRIGSTGVLAVTATGRVNGVERAVRAELRKRTFLDYLYFTEYETQDPSAYPRTGSRNQAWAAQNCSRHRYDSPGRHSDCYDITWIGGDVVEGPFHSNDQIVVSGSPTWRGPATTSRPDGMYYDSVANRNCRGRNNPVGCSSNPSFSQGLQFRPALTLPPSNNQIKAEADPTLGGDGCMYVGATFIRFHANGTATVRSAKTDSSGGNCPTNGTMAELPDNGVIYVRSARPNESCLSGPPHPYNLAADVTEYNRCAGDVFVEGTLNGRVTIAAENNIIISDHVRYAGGRGAATDDMLGLVANNFVEVMHPVNRGGQNLNYLPGGRNFNGPHIDAAILSVEHSFRVQNHNEGAPFSDPISVFGTISQLYRGPVGTFSGNRTVSGYEKDYEYDPRLAYVSPPHFLDPVQSAWSIRSVSEEQAR